MTRLLKIKLLGICALFSVECIAIDRYVSPSGTNNYPFTNWPDAATNIEWAVNAGLNGDTVWISNGTYVLTNQITVSSNISICGYPDGSLPIIDGNNSNRCFYFVNSAGGTISNLFITRGSTNGNGGGVYMAVGGAARGAAYDCVFSNNTAVLGCGGGLYGGVRASNCVFIQNSAAAGGGYALINEGSTTGYFFNCSFITNSAYYTNTWYNSSGGGMFILSCKIAISNCTFACNVASNSGGLYAYDCRGYFINSSIVSNVAVSNYGGIMIGNCASCIFSNLYISNNVAGGDGGGICLYGNFSAPSVLNNSIIAHNISTKVAASANDIGGGGVFCGYPYPTGTLKNCLIEENICYSQGAGVSAAAGVLQNCLIRNNCAYGTTGGNGGGIYFREYNQFYIQNCTIVSNYAYTSGGGLGVCFGLYVFVDNSIIYGNTCDTAANSNYWITSSGASFTNCCLAPALTGSSTNYSTNNISADPLFIDRTTGNYRLAQGSPCINAGVNRDWMNGAVDLDGHSRLDRYSRMVDMGCYEYLPSGMLITIPGSGH